LDNPPRSHDKRSQAVDVFWETFPPLWRMIHAHIRQVAEEQFHITVEQFHVLRHIRRGHDSVSRLAVTKRISRPAISQSVDLLVKGGYIVRTIDQQDRRHIHLKLTESGNGLMDSIYDEIRRWMVEAFSPLSKEEIDGFIRVMETLRKIL
jgi:MarR family transcriptional regulator, organic hydroperoxide resistance regulator